LVENSVNSCKNKGVELRTAPDWLTWFENKPTEEKLLKEFEIVAVIMFKICFLFLKNNF